jgi:hypothetical protein
MKTVEERLDALESRNKRVEVDKRWGTSLERRFCYSGTDLWSYWYFFDLDWCSSTLDKCFCTQYRIYTFNVNSAVAKDSLGKAPHERILKSTLPPY